LSALPIKLRAGETNKSWDIRLFSLFADRLMLFHFCCGHRIPVQRESDQGIYYTIHAIRSKTITFTLHIHQIVTSRTGFYEYDVECTSLETLLWRSAFYI